MIDFFPPFAIALILTFPSIPKVGKDTLFQKMGIRQFSSWKAFAGALARMVTFENLEDA